MNLADIIILTLVVLIVAWVLLRAFRHKKDKNSIKSDSCPGCAYKGFCGKISKKQ